MKTSTLLLLGFVSFFTISLLPEQAKAQYDDDDVDFSVFYNELSPYGNWINTPQYGRVWHYGDPSFRPYYTNGDWDYTSDGWSWNSRYPWGWATFHYGRWEYDAFYGWLWIPGYQWAPAWVSWSEADDCYGWAPLGFGASLNISFGSIPRDRWAFVPRRYMGERNISNYYINGYNNRYYGNARLINNRDRREYFRGPDLNDVSRYNRNRIETHQGYDRRFDGRRNDQNGFGRRDNDRRFEGMPDRRGNDRRFDGTPDRRGNNGRFEGTPERRNDDGRFPGSPDRRDNNRRFEGTPERRDNDNRFGNGIPNNRDAQPQRDNGNLGFPRREAERRPDGDRRGNNGSNSQDMNQGRPSGGNDNRGWNNGNNRDNQPSNPDRIGGFGGRGNQSPVQQPRFEQRSIPEPAPSGGQPRNYGNDGIHRGRPERGRMN
jgi:hypothetical protein